MSLRIAALYLPSYLLLYLLLSAQSEAFSEPLGKQEAGATQEALASAVSVEWMRRIESRRLDESSGLATSQRYADVLWSMNDSGGEAELFALTIRGAHIGHWYVDLPKPTDWEAMDSFQWRGKNYLLIADIGNNFAMRDSVSYTILEEPDAITLTDSAILRPIVTQRFVYPNGPRDREAIAVDPVREEILVLSKRTKPPELYRLPLSLAATSDTQKHADTSEPITASHIASLEGFVAPGLNEVDLYGEILAYLAMPTGMSIADDRLLITTPEHAYLFDLNDLEKPPSRLMLPLAGQREAITFAKDRSDQAYVSHERRYGLRSADIYRVNVVPIRSTSSGILRSLRWGTCLHPTSKPHWGHWPSVLGWHGVAQVSAFDAQCSARGDEECDTAY